MHEYKVFVFFKLNIIFTLKQNLLKISKIKIIFILKLHLFRNLLLNPWIFYSYFYAIYRQINTTFTSILFYNWRLWWPLHGVIGAALAGPGPNGWHNLKENLSELHPFPVKCQPWSWSWARLTMLAGGDGFAIILILWADIDPTFTENPSASLHPSSWIPQI